MFAPNVKLELQKNIIQDRVENLRPDTRIPWKFVGDAPKMNEQHARLRLWKMLREMDVAPVFMPHLEEELYSLVRSKLRRRLVADPTNWTTFKVGSSVWLPKEKVYAKIEWPYSGGRVGLRFKRSGVEVSETWLVDARGLGVDGRPIISCCGASCGYCKERD